MNRLLFFLFSIVFFLYGCYMEDKLGPLNNISLSSERPILKVNYVKEDHRLDVAFYLPYKTSGEIEVIPPESLKVNPPKKEFLGQGPHEVSFYFTSKDKIKGGSGEAVIKITDKDGNQFSERCRVEVKGLSPDNTKPRFIRERCYYREGKLYLTFFDPDPEELSVTLTEPYGLQADKTFFTVEGGNYCEKIINWQADDPMLGGDGYTYVQLKDFRGLTDEVKFYLNIPPANHSPQGLSISYDSTYRYLLVKATDEDAGDTLTFSLTLPAGIKCDEGIYSTSEFPVEHKFYLYPEDVLSGGKGVATVEVKDKYNQHTFLSCEVEIPGFSPEVDTLYGVPQKLVVKVGEPVKVAIITGDTSNNFYALKRLRVVVEKSVWYKYDSFNVGSFGNAPGYIDGIWAYMPNLEPFPIPPYGLLNQEYLSNNRIAYDFYLLPQNGDNIKWKSGYLCNFEFLPQKEGVYNIRFQVQDVSGKKTYYEDKEGNSYYWFEADNNYPGIPNSFKVISPD